MNNEPAFPCGTDVTQNQFAPSCGMTIRDYFAAKAMQGMLPDCPLHYETIAINSFKLADAMLAAREKTK